MLASVLIVPALVLYLLTVAGGGWLPLVGALAMVPGVLMGGAVGGDALTVHLHPPVPVMPTPGASDAGSVGE